MSKGECKHTHLQVAAAILRREGRISAYEAVYDAVCPWDGSIRRNLRLAATVHTLRHVYRWVIETHQKEGEAADYVLREHKVFPVLPSDPANPVASPLRAGDRYRIENVPSPKRWACTECTQRIENPHEKVLGGYARALCPNRDCPSQKRSLAKKMAIFKPLEGVSP